MVGVRYDDRAVGVLRVYGRELKRLHLLRVVVFKRRGSAVLVRVVIPAL